MHPEGNNITGLFIHKDIGSSLLVKKMNNNSSFQNESVVLPHHSSLPVWLAVILVLDFFGALANAVTFVATLVYNPLRKSSSSVILAHCILLDLVVTGFVYPITAVVTYVQTRWLLPAHFCRGFGAVFFFAIYLNDWAHAVMAVNRFIGAVLPHYYKQVTTRPALIVAVVMPWLASVLINFAATAEITLRYELSDSWPLACIPGPDKESALIIMPLFGTYIPSVLIGISYTAVMITAKQAVRRKVGDDSGVTRLSIRLGQRYETSKTLFVCFLWYCLANFPLPVTSFYFPEELYASMDLQFAFLGLQYMSSAVNPVFFIAVSRNYRHGVLYVLEKIKGRAFGQQPAFKPESSH